jgi:hypothetical protein
MAGLRETIDAAKAILHASMQPWMLRASKQTGMRPRNTHVCLNCRFSRRAHHERPKAFDTCKAFVPEWALLVKPTRHRPRSSWRGYMPRAEQELARAVNAQGLTRILPTRSS